MNQTQYEQRQSSLHGPRDSKLPGSVEWCWQTLFMLKCRWENYEIAEEEFQVVISDLKSHRAWEVVPPDNPYGTIDAMLEAEIGVSLTEANARYAVRLGAEYLEKVETNQPLERPRGRPEGSKNKVPPPDSPPGDDIDQVVENEYSDDNTRQEQDHPGRLGRPPGSKDTIDRITKLPKSSKRPKPYCCPNNVAVSDIKFPRTSNTREVIASRIAKKARGGGEDAALAGKVLEGMANGEYSSTNAAAEHAKVKKVYKPFPENDPAGAARAIKRYYSGEPLQEIIRLLQAD